MRSRGNAAFEHDDILDYHDHHLDDHHHQHYDHDHDYDDHHQHDHDDGRARRHTGTYDDDHDHGRDPSTHCDGDDHGDAAATPATASTGTAAGRPLAGGFRRRRVHGGRRAVPRLHRRHRAEPTD